MVGARSPFPLSKKEVIIKEQGRKERKAPTVMDSPETSVGAHVSLTIGTDYSHKLLTSVNIYVYIFPSSVT